MLQTLFEIVIANAVTATLLAIGVALFARLCRRPAVAHWLWLMVFLKLITPPLITFPLTILPPPQEFHESPATVVSVEKSATCKSQSPAITVVVAPANTSSLAPASPAEFQWRNYVVVGIIGIWTAGTCGWSLLLVTRIWRFHRVARRTALAPAALQHRVEHLATAFGLPTLPQVRVIHAQVSPLMWRLDGRPVILLPAELLAELTARPDRRDSRA